MFVSLIFCLIASAHSAPNFVFVLTDDQDLLLNGLLPMQKTLRLVANEGITFANAFANSPICCPSRSTILTGKYLHSTHVTNNSISGNCSSPQWQMFHENESFAAVLHEEVGYRTFYAGKYLNQYGMKEAGGTEHIPIGYDWWIGLKGNSKYYNYTLSINGTAKTYAEDYLTDVIKQFALDFLNQKETKDTPFLMTLAPPAAHEPFTPAPRHKNAFPNMKAVRTPSFNYTPHDKHWLVAMNPTHLPDDVGILDDIQRRRMQTLLAVDEMVEEIILKLTEIEVLNNTYVIFTSDNGYHIGQFTQSWDKRQPYDTDVRVPFLMRGPFLPHKQLIKHPISMVDIAPTILDLAGLEPPESMDGESFKEFLQPYHDAPAGRVFVEYFGEGNPKTVGEECGFDKKQKLSLSGCFEENWCKCQDSINNTFNCVIHFKHEEQLKFCVFRDNDNFVEAYDLTADPYELNNILKTMTSTSISYYKHLLKNLG